jgi:hypothetical protein
MLRVDYKRWKASQLIVQLEGTMKAPYQLLLQELAIPADGASAAFLYQEATLHGLNEDRYEKHDYLEHVRRHAKPSNGKHSRCH